jgi:thioredoxin-like negative regulator of GroEL
MSVHPLRRARHLGTVGALAAAAALLGAMEPARAGAATVAAAAQPGKLAEVAWLSAASDADIERAYALAREQGKPVLLYWGAKWCPPCNQLKATLFNRADFIERSRAVVPVYVDGDLPGAQKLGGRFKVRGYPTMILLNAQGQEITRLPGEVDAPQVLRVLQLGLSGGRPVKAVLADAQAKKPLRANDWKLLAWYAWDVDEDQLVKAADRPGLLAQLAAQCPAREADTRQRLLLKALAASDEGKGLKPDAATRAQVLKFLADAAAVRGQMDVVANNAAEIVKALEPEAGERRAALARAFDAALRQLQNDATLSRGDRVSALASRVALARLDQPKDERQPRLPEALLAEARAQAASMDREITDGYERQAVITSNAYVLGEAGLWKDSDELLKANLPKSHSPYYLMSALASNARKQGRTEEALRWSEEAYARSEGPATRLQWGASYISLLVDLAPADEARIERAVQQLLADAAQDSAAFHERSARSLQRVANKLSGWNAKGAHEAVLQRLQQRLDGVCSKLDAADATQRRACDNLLRPGGRAA